MRSTIATLMTTGALAATVLDIPGDVSTKWMVFKKMFGKQYEEETERFNVFAANDKMIMEHNAKGLSWSLGHNEFSDLTQEEFRAVRITGYIAQNRTKNYNKDLKNLAPPDSVDWVSAGAVTPIKDQGQCGSCWAFSAVGAMEGAYQIAGNELTQFSEQDLVSCDNKGQDQGCNGGLMDNAFTFVKANGLCTEDDYPYTSGGGTTGSCKSGCSPALTLTGFTDVASEADMTAAISIGPVSVAVEADTNTWQFYSGGVLDDKACGTSLDHGVLAVGYGTDSGKDYYNVKNSWGTSWGEKGYIRLVRGKNQCGIASAPSYPTGVAPVAPPAPTAPTPVPPPTPVVDDCDSTLDADCGDDKSNPLDCVLCAYSSQDVAAVCSDEDIMTYCGFSGDLPKFSATA